jgi:hypothetical protein
MREGRQIRNVISASICAHGHSVGLPRGWLYRDTDTFTNRKLITPSIYYR